MRDGQSATETVSRLDPQMAAAMDKMAEIAAALPPMPADPSLAELRRQMVEEKRFWNDDAPNLHEVVNASLPGLIREVPVRVYRPAPGDDLPGILYFHGGGWVKGSLDTHDRIMRLLALASGAVVLGVDYALAPEHRFPEPYEESIVVVEGVAGAADKLGIDPGRLAVSGDSAGANLALAAAIDLRDRRPGLIRAAALFYGVFDSDFDTASYREFGDGRFGLSREEMIYFWKKYARTPDDLTDPRAAPARAALNRLMPIFLAAAELDVLRDDTMGLAERLGSAGVPFELKEYPGVCHGFLGLTRMVDKAVNAIEDAAAFLVRHL